MRTTESGSRALSARADDLWFRLIGWYYLATPVFFAIDLFLHAPIRVAGIASGPWRYAYYLMLIGLAGVCRLRPRLAPVVGMAESSVNLLLLILSVLLPIWGMTDALIANENAPIGFGQDAVWNLLLVGPMLVLSFKRSERALFEATRQT